MPLLDRSGAEPLPDSNPENLVEFGIMGCVFLEDGLARTTLQPRLCPLAKKTCGVTTWRLCKWRLYHCSWSEFAGCDQKCRPGCILKLNQHQCCCLRLET